VTDAEIETTILRLCAARTDGGTICPSDVARTLATDEAAWRGMMPRVRQVASKLAAEQRIDVTQRGVVVDVSTARGPVRLRQRATARPDADEITP
jgi:hypothetical protein